MLAKTNRLLRRDIPSLMKHGRRLSTSHLTCVYQKSPTPRFAIVVSKKVAKTAVTRNRLRRRVYALLQTLPNGMPQVEGMIIVQRGAPLLSVGQLTAEINDIMAKARR